MFKPELRVISIDAFTHKPPLDWRHRYRIMTYRQYCDQVVDYFKTHNFGVWGWVLPSNIVVVDVDIRNNGMASFIQLLHDLHINKKDLRNYCIVKSGRNGFHVFFFTYQAVSIYKTLKKYPGIDFLSNGCYVVLVHSKFDPASYTLAEQQHIESLGTYDLFVPQMVFDKAFQPIPEKLLTMLEKKQTIADAVYKATGWCVTPDELKAMLNKIPPLDFRAYHDWRNVCFACCDACFEGQEVFYEWSISDTLFSDHAKVSKEISYMWHPAKLESESITKATLYAYYKQYAPDQFYELCQKKKKEEENKSIQFMDSAVEKQHTYMKDIELSLLQTPLDTSKKLSEVIQKEEPNKSDLLKVTTSLDMMDYYYLLNEDKFYHLPSRTLITISTFNKLFKVTLKKELASLKESGKWEGSIHLLPSTFFCHLYYLDRFMMSKKFLPWSDPVILSYDDKAKYLNSWHKPRPLTYTNENIDFWHDFTHYLISNDEQREHFHNFLSVLIRESIERPRFALMLYSSREGVGKTSPLDILLRRAIGSQYVGVISNHDLTSGYTANILDNIVCLVNDVSATKRYDTQNLLKPLITDDYVSRTQKYEKSDTRCRNVTSFILSTNDPDSLAIGVNDRRYYVVDCDVEPRSDAYFSDFFGKLTEAKNLESLIYWYRNREVPSQFTSRPPHSSLKQAIYEASLPHMARLFLSLIQSEDIPYIHEFVFTKLLYDKKLAFDLKESYNKNYKAHKAVFHLGYTIKSLWRCPKNLNAESPRYQVYRKRGVELDNKKLLEQYQYIMAM